MLRRWLLRLATLSCCSGPLFGAAFSLLCYDGECINCMSCFGDCTRECRCFGQVNTCCCPAPLGHYARGYTKIACPGGTYQDELGQAACKPCDDDGDDAVYNLSARGAISTADCSKAKCDCSDAKKQQVCDEHCVTPEEVVDFMTAEPRDVDFCEKLDVAYGSCTWQVKSNAHQGTPALLTVGLLLLGFLSA